MKAPDLIAGVFSQFHPEGYQRDTTLRDTCACQLVMKLALVRIGWPSPAF